MAGEEKRGLTLMEILVSLVLFSLVIVGFVNVYISAKRYTIHSRSRITAGELGRYFIEPLQLNVSQDSWNLASNPLSVPSPLVNASLTIDNIVYGVNYSVSNITVGTSQVRKVKVSINWNENTP